MHHWSENIATDVTMPPPVRPKGAEDPKVRIRQDLYEQALNLTFETRGLLSITGIVNTALEKHLPTISITEKPKPSPLKERIIAAINKMEPAALRRIEGLIRMLGHEPTVRISPKLSDHYRKLVDIITAPWMPDTEEE
jgi:hypothetical protein